MKALARLVITCADLLEAEGRSLRHSLFRLGLALALAVSAAALTFAGCAWAIWAVYLALVPQTGEAWAAAIAGMTMLVLAGTLLWIAQRQNR